MNEKRNNIEKTKTNTDSFKKRQPFTLVSVFTVWKRICGVRYKLKLPNQHKIRIIA